MTHDETTKLSRFRQKSNFNFAHVCIYDIYHKNLSFFMTSFTVQIHILAYNWETPLPYTLLTQTKTKTKKKSKAFCF